jgi:HisJ family histidinol phosphate phosphatase
VRLELADCHTHTFYSDGHNSVEDNVARACELGLATVCLTDHLTLPQQIDPTCEVSVAEKDLPAYGADILAARAAHPEIDVVYGFECDYYPGCEDNVRRWTQGATFRLGSVHMVDLRWIDDLSDLSFWDSHSVDYVWEGYFRLWGQACKCGLFDSMAHPDLVSLLGRYPDEELMQRLFAQAACDAREAGVHVEVNTAGMIKPVGRFYPHPNLLSCFAKAEVPLTVGSDAHVVSRIGEGIADAYSLAASCGYQSVEVPLSGGGWRTIPIT